MVMRFGIRYAHPRDGAPENAVYNYERELFDVELDVVYEMNSAMDGYRVDIENVNLDDSLIPIPSINLFLAHNWKDTVSLRLGGSVNLLRGHLTISAGLSWESNSVPEEYTRLDYLGWMRYGLGLGIIGRFWLMEIALSYQHIFMPNRDVSNGDVYAPIATASANNMSDDVVNNGQYEAGYDVIGFSLGFRFDRPHHAQATEEETPSEETATPEETTTPENTTDEGSVDEGPADDSSVVEPPADEGTPTDEGAPADETAPEDDSSTQEMPLESI